MEKGGIIGGEKANTNPNAKTKTKTNTNTNTNAALFAPEAVRLRPRVRRLRRSTKKLGDPRKQKLDTLANKSSVALA